MQAITRTMAPVMENQLIPSCLLVFILLLQLPLLGQAPNEPGCGTTEVQNELYEMYPHLEAEYQKFVEEHAGTVRDRDGRRSLVITIPVVFHVLHQYGVENISDAQIHDQMEILNRDFRKLNPDTTDIVPQFRAIATDSRLEFKLATIDPAGNCTNGIDRIYTHETVNGDNFSKLNQWRRASYLNVWVVKTMNRPGVAGYAYYPSSVDGQLYYLDGIVILHNYLGSIGTSNYNRSRTLTHEIGHYLGLSHPWGGGSVGEACGDDGIQDTPLTKGWSTCNLGNSAVCNPPIQENVQNYMEYAYCSRMFTEGQAQFMNSVLNNPNSKRNNLWIEENLTGTGADVPVQPLCTPVPEFTVNRNYVCEGGVVKFTSQTWRAQVDQYEWTFEGGNPSTSNQADPLVTYNSAGIYPVQLKVSNAAGTESHTEEQFIVVSNSNTTDYAGHFSEDFESDRFENEFIVENPENNEASWKRSLSTGYSGGHSVKLDNYQEQAGPFYFGMLGQNKDAFITPSMDISGVQGAKLTFRYSAATTATSSDQISEELRVYASNNCGTTWNMLGRIAGVALANAGFWGQAYNQPSHPYWTLTGFNIPSQFTNNVRFKIEYTSSDWSNNVFIDDLRVHNFPVAVDMPDESALGFHVYPNPQGKEGTIHVAYTTQEPGAVLITVRDVLGRTLYENQEEGDRKEQVKQISITELGLGSGIYFISLSANGLSETRKLTIL